MPRTYLVIGSLAMPDVHSEKGDHGRVQSGQRAVPALVRRLEHVKWDTVVGHNVAGCNKTEMCVRTVPHPSSYCLPTVGIGVEFQGNHKRAVLRYSILEKGRVLAGPERPLAVPVRKPAILHAELGHPLGQWQSMFTGTREVLAVQLPTIDKLCKRELQLIRELLCRRSYHLLQAGHRSHRMRPSG